jgi:HEAT repeat protein
MTTRKNVDHLASKLLRTSPDPEVRSVAAAALSDTNPPAHTRSRVASLAGSLMHDGNKLERSVAASVLSDHKQNERR